MTTRPSTHFRRLIVAIALLGLTLAACEYRPERGAIHISEEATETPHGEESGEPTPDPKGTEGITDPGLGPTNPPPRATGDYRLRTLAGSGSRTYLDGQGGAAAFINPVGIAVASDGTVYVADEGANRIRKITRNGTVTTIAGSGTEGHRDGAAAQAQFRRPRGVAIGANGTLYVADTQNHVIRAITAAGQVSTIVGTPGTKGFKNAPGRGAQLNAPVAIAVSADLKSLYVSEFDNHTIRLMSSSGRVVRTLAGTGRKGFKDGGASQAQFDSPVGIAVDAEGTVYVSDAANDRVRTISGGTVRTLAGSRAGFKDGTGTSALFNIPYGLTIDRSGVLYVTEFSNNSIRSITRAGVVKTVLATSGSPGPNSLNLPAGLAWLGGRLFVADSGNSKIRIAERS